MSIHDYASLILKGYCFCHLYNTSLAEFGQREKTISNFQQTNFLWLDVDNATLKMDEALSLLTYKPNLAYTTMSNNIEGKGYRFRFIYLTNFTIQSNDEYIFFLNLLINSITNDIGQSILSNLDNKCWNTSQQMLGGKSNSLIRLNKAYLFSRNIFDNIQSNIEVKDYISNKCTHSSKLKNKRREKAVTQNIEMSTLRKNVLELYKSNFHIDLSNVNTATLDPQMIYSDISEQDIYELKFLLDKNKQEKKITKGHRNKTLFYHAIVLRNIKPDISVEELACTLYWIYQHKYEVSTDLSITNICKTALNVMKLDSSTESFKKAGKRKYLINPIYKALPIELKRKELGKARRKKRNEYILSNFDCNKTIEENAKELNIAASTIYAAFKENKIEKRNDTKFQNFLEAYWNNHGASIRELSKLTKLATSTIQRYLQRIHSSTTEKHSKSHNNMKMRA